MPPKTTRKAKVVDPVTLDEDYVKENPKRVIVDQRSVAKEEIGRQIEISKAKLFELENVHADKFEELEKVKKCLREEKRILKAMKYEFKSM